MNEFDGADVDATGRLGGEQHLERAAHLAGDDDLLLVAAGQRTRGEHRIVGPNVERLNLPPRVLEYAVEIEAHAVREMMLLAEDQVLSHGIVEDQAALVAVFRNVRQSRIAAPFHGETRDVAPPDG